MHRNGRFGIFEDPLGDKKKVEERETKTKEGTGCMLFQFFYEYLRLWLQCWSGRENHSCLADD
jgi:hypothetical protein